MASGQQPADPTDPPAMPKNHRKFLIPAIEAASAAGIAVAIGMALLLLFFLYRRLVRNRSSVITASSPPPSDPGPPLRRFSYGHLRRATSRFAPSRKLGQGGFGPVFRGSLGSDNDIAVKLMDSGSLQGDREFHNELALAAKILTSGSDADRKWVVVPFGFCCHQSKKRWWRRLLLSKDSDQQVVDDAYADGDGLGKRVMLVYDLMHNGSLQDALLHKKCPELLDWGRRFSVAVDIAKGLQFLHSICDPPVIHGDIKPSNILLDSRLSARIADFGLARIKAGTSVEGAEEVVVEIDTKPPKEEEKKKDLALAVVPWGGEDDVSVMGETVDSATTVGVDDVSGSFANGIVVDGRSPEEQDAGTAMGKAPEGDEPAFPSVAVDVASTSEAYAGCDGVSVDSGKDMGDRSKLWKKGGGGGGMFSGKEWWWRQDHGGGGNTEVGGGVKDYVMEWIKSEIKKERPKSDWITAPSVSAEDCLPRTIGKLDKKKQQRRSEWWASLDEERQNKKKNRPAREWWREEFCEELTRKQQKKRMTAMSESSTEGGEKQAWWQKDEDNELPTQRKKRRKKKNNWSTGTSIDWWMDGHSGEMKSSGMRRSSRDWTGGGEVPKSGGTVSSTPSMRGTVCYVAPEYGGGGPLSEKCDIYSFGVLLLVLISGRRPLQVTASPMSEFERANLISWARHLARLGRLMDLVDPTLRQVDKEQTLLCITVALLCIQRSPARRPSIKEIVGMLTGQSELPHLPVEFSPSPPGGFSFKSRRKAR